MKCAEASWLLEVIFWDLPTRGCYLGHDICYFGCPKPIIWQAWCLHFSPWGPFCQLEDIRGGHGRSHGGPEPDFRLFLMIWGAHFDSFLISDGLSSVFFFELVSRSLFASIFWAELLTVGAFKTRFSHGRYCNNQVFAKIVYWWFEGRFLVFFGGPGSRFSEFFCFGNRLENWVFFKVALGILIGTRK